MLKKLATACAFALLSSAHAQIIWPDGFSIRLAKTPDARDADKPATLGYQRNDGGKRDYISQGAIKFDQDFGDNNLSTFSPSLAWNHNTIATQPTDTWSANFAVKHRIVQDNLDALVLSASVGSQHDQSKSSTSTTTKLSANWFGWPEWKRQNSSDFAALRPTLTVFSKRVSKAAPDKITGIVPTGTLSGAVFALDGQVQLGRWMLAASSQYLQPNQVVRGDTKVRHELHTASLTYQFVDPPTTGTQSKAAGFIPGISLIRQVGDDPLNAIARAGFTQLVLTVRY